MRVYKNIHISKFIFKSTVKIVNEIAPLVEIVRLSGYCVRNEVTYMTES